MNSLADTLGFYYGFVNPFQRYHINVTWEFAYEEKLFEITNTNGSNENIMGHFRVVISGL